eukprot:2634286-Lingulodinium_polyedra.AAC.1
MVLLGAPDAVTVGRPAVLLEEVAGCLALDRMDNGLQIAVNRLRPALALHVEVAHERLEIDSG